MPSILSAKDQLDVPISRAKSVNSNTSSAPSYYSDADIRHGKTLLIGAHGIGWSFGSCWFTKELEVPISDVNGNVVYMSTRATKKSNNAVLSDAGGNLIATKYFWGPGRDPKMYFVMQNPLNKEYDGAEKNGNGVISDELPLGDEIQTKSKWIRSTHQFIMPDGRQFQWHYAKDTNINGGYQTEKMLVCREMNGKHTGRRIAQLVRNDETRTPGTKKNDAGNGGELIIDMENAHLIEEPVVVATCLMMLKKEVDRRKDAEAAILVS